MGVGPFLNPTDSQYPGATLFPDIDETVRPFVAPETGGFVYSKAGVLYYRNATGEGALTVGVPVVSVLSFGAKGDGITNDDAAFAAAKAAVPVNGALLIPPPAVSYRLETPFVFPRLTVAYGQPRLLYDGNATTYGFGYIGNPYVYDAYLGSCILDVNGKAAYALEFQGAINPVIDRVRVTNATVAGFHGNFVQSGIFRQPVCSFHVEAFTTQPVNGILFDTVNNSDNLIEGMVVEGVSGSGIKIAFGINNTILGGTSEGNAVGIECSGTAHNNHCVTVDVEANTVVDVLCTGASVYGNTFTAMAGASPNGVHVTAAASYNSFVGGTMGGITLDAGTADNQLIRCTLLGASATIADSGTRTVIQGCSQLSLGSRFADQIPRDTKFLAKFGCNGAVPQAVYVSGGAVVTTTPTLAAYGYTLTQAQAVLTLVNNIRAALVANGIMS